MNRHNLDLKRLGQAVLEAAREHYEKDHAVSVAGH